MRRLVAWFVDALPFDIRSRRAIDETLADWLLEERERPTGIARVTVDIRSAISVARVASFALLREAGDFEWTRGLAHRARVVVGIATALGLIFTWWAFGSLLGSWWSLAGFFMIPPALLFLLPPAIVLALSWRPVNSAPLPSVGAATVVALATLCISAVLIPVSFTVVAISMSEGLREAWKDDRDRSGWQRLAPPSAPAVRAVADGCGDLRGIGRSWHSLRGCPAEASASHERLVARCCPDRLLGLAQTLAVRD